MNLEFTVPSTFLRSLKPGAKVTARTDDLPGMTFDGEIATLDNAIDPVSRSVRVRATLANPERILMSGMFMEIVLVADPRQSLAIPEQSVQPVGPKTFVFKIDNSGDKPVAKRTEVKLGALDKGYIELLSGLAENDQVITEGVIRVRDGAAVKIQDISMLKPSANRTGARSGGGMGGVSRGNR